MTGREEIATATGTHLTSIEIFINDIKKNSFIWEYNDLNYLHIN